jgi:hypothetical protein
MWPLPISKQLTESACREHTSDVQARFVATRRLSGASQRQVEHSEKTGNTQNSDLSYFLRA